MLTLEDENKIAATAVIASALPESDAPLWDMYHSIAARPPHERCEIARRLYTAVEQNFGWHQRPATRMVWLQLGWPQAQYRSPETELTDAEWAEVNRVRNILSIAERMGTAPTLDEIDRLISPLTAAQMIKLTFELNAYRGVFMASDRGLPANPNRIADASDAELLLARDMLLSGTGSTGDPISLAMIEGELRRRKVAHAPLGIQDWPKADVTAHAPVPQE